MSNAKCNSNSCSKNTYSHGFMCMINKKGERKCQNPTSNVQNIDISPKTTSLILIAVMTQ